MAPSKRRTAASPKKGKFWRFKLYFVLNSLGNFSDSWTVPEVAMRLLICDRDLNDLQRFRVQNISYFGAIPLFLE